MGGKHEEGREIGVSPAFWLGVWHRATPGIDYSPTDAPHLPPKWATDWRKGWCDADQVSISEGYAALRDYGIKANTKLSGSRLVTGVDERRGIVLPMEGGPWDGQEMYVPTRPRKPDEVTFPVRWHDGTWDNAHWQHLYVLRGTGTDYAPYKLEYGGIVFARGLTEAERDQIRDRQDELLGNARSAEALMADGEIKDVY